MSSPAFAFVEKSPEAFRSISEAASDLDLPQHVLRFWESRFVQLKPVKRAGGRRYYRPEDIDLLRGIRALLYSDGLTIRGVQKLLKDRGVRHVAGIGRGARFSPSVPLPPMPRPVQAVDLFAAEPAPAVGLAAAERARLESLLAELLGLKQRLKARRA
ncbi:MAG: MerR family transcriptional regulator [Alphaproteobacteria bacterium]|nr:MerR family transcriptional regulator [Alphaproteobacteria bacterium]